jgi:hypothetical protein
MSKNKMYTCKCRQTSPLTLFSFTVNAIEKRRGKKLDTKNIRPVCCKKFGKTFKLY